VLKPGVDTVNILKKCRIGGCINIISYSRNFYKVVGFLCKHFSLGVYAKMSVTLRLLKMIKFQAAGELKR